DGLRPAHVARFFDLDPAHDYQRASTSAAHEGGGRRDAMAARNAWLRAVEIAAARPDPPVRSRSRRLHPSVGRKERASVGMSKIGATGVQQSFHLLGRLADHRARLAGLNLALELDEALSRRCARTVAT